MALSLAPLAIALLPMTDLPQGVQEAAADEQTILSASEIRSLNVKVQKWFEAQKKYEDATNRKQRETAGRNQAKAKTAFDREWEAKSKKSDLLASVADIKAVFENAFPYERKSTSGEIKLQKASKNVPAYNLIEPKRYDPETAYRTILLLPGFDDGKGSWAGAKECFEGTWKGAGIVDQTIFVIPDLDNGMVLDRIPDFTAPTGEEDEVARIRASLGASGEVQREYNMDRERFIIDCGRGSSGFGLRLASYFPDRFAGVILRWPVDVSSQRVGSLTGLPVLLIASEQTKQACADLAKRLNDQVAGSCTLLDGEGDYPFSGMQAKIEGWVASVRRNLNRTKVVVEPNSDKFKWGYWVSIGTAEPLASVAVEDRPFLIAEADKKANRITITAKSVSDFALYLNDEIIDLDKPFTVVVNGQAIKEQRSRSLRYLHERLSERYDPTYIFTAQYEGSVPKTEAVDAKKTDGN